MDSSVMGQATGISCLDGMKVNYEDMESGEYPFWFSGRCLVCIYACLLTRLRPRILSHQRSTVTTLVSPPAVLVYVPDTNLLSTSVACGLMPFRHQCPFLRVISLARTITMLRTGNHVATATTTPTSWTTNTDTDDDHQRQIKAHDAYCSTQSAPHVGHTASGFFFFFFFLFHNSGAFQLASHPSPFQQTSAEKR